MYIYEKIIFFNIFCESNITNSANVKNEETFFQGKELPEFYHD